MTAVLTTPHPETPSSDPPIPFRDRYLHRGTITKEACGRSSHISAWEHGGDLTAERNWCKRWDEERCARRMGKAEIESASRVPISAVLWRDGSGDPAEDARTCSRVRQWLRRHGLESLMVRRNGSLWWFIRGDANATLLARGEQRYGFTVLITAPDPSVTESFLTTAFGREEAPLLGLRKFKPSDGFYRVDYGDEDEGIAGNDAIDSYGDLDRIREESIASLREAQKGTDPPDPRGRRIQFHAPASTVAEKRRELEADERYRVRGLGEEDCWRAEWIGGGQRPSWNFPNVHLQGF